MIRTIEKLVLFAVLGAMPPLIGLLTCWWSTFSWLPERFVAIAALSGLAAGLLADVFWLRRWVRRAFDFSWKTWMGVYLFYAFGTWGFFMGVPVFIVGLALPAGLIVGGILAHHAATREQTDAGVRRARLCTTGMLALFCTASAAIAFLNPSTDRELELMLRLPFTVTQAHIAALVVIGGSGLLVLNWLLIAAVARWTVRRFAVAEATAA